MTSSTPTQSPAATAKRKRLRFRRPTGPGPIRPLDLLFLAVGLTALISGIVMFVSSGSETVATSGKVSLTSVLDAARAGDLSSVRLVPSTGAGTATVTRAGATSMLAEDLGVPLAVGDVVRFTAPSTVQALLAETLADADVPMWLEGGSLNVAQYRPLGAAPSAGSNATVAVAPDPGSGPGPLPYVLVVLGSLLTLVGVARLVGARQTAKQTAAAAAPPANIPSTRFTDVAGADEAVEQLREVVACLQDPEAFRRLGAKIPKGALLVGPPGTGKTLLARAVAGEAGVSFHPSAGSDFVEMYVGVGPKRIRELFARARKAERAIIFIDEIDAVARRRSSDGGGSGGHVEGENTLIALLNEMDGFTESNIIVIGATNRPDILDPAIMRPGRLDRRIEVPLPDRRGRTQILGVHAKGVPFAPEVDFASVAARTPGFSGAQLENVVNEAALEAVRRELDVVDSRCLDAAVAMVAMGRARASAIVTEHDRLVTAWHEAGHTVAALLLAEADAPVAVSIVPRGPAGGVTWMRESENLFLSRAKAHARLVVALAGRAAEEMHMEGEFTQGAASDLDQATDTALLMATRYGMTRLGLASRERHLGGTKTPEVAEVVEELLANALAEATELLTTHEDLVRGIADALMDREDLDAGDLAELAAQFGVTPASKPVPMPVPPVHPRSRVADPTDTPAAPPPAAPRAALPAAKPRPARTRVRTAIGSLAAQLAGRGSHTA